MSETLQNRFKAERFLVCEREEYARDSKDSIIMDYIIDLHDFSKLMIVESKNSARNDQLFMKPAFSIAFAANDSFAYRKSVVVKQMNIRFPDWQKYQKVDGWLCFNPIHCTEKGDEGDFRYLVII